MSPNFFEDNYRPLRSSSFNDPISTYSNESRSDPLESGKRLSREERLRSLRQDAMNDFLPGTATFIAEKLMVTTGTKKKT